MKKTRLTVLLLVGLLGVFAFGQTIVGGQWSTDNHAYSLAQQGKEKAVGWYDAAKTAPRAWFGYGLVGGTDLTEGVAVGGAGAWAFYEFDRGSHWGLTGSVGYVWPAGGKGNTVLGLGLGFRT